MQKYDLDRFDIAALITIAVLALAIGGVVLAGDNVGVHVESYSPQEFGESSAAVRIRFYEEMSPASVEQGFSISPSVEGSFRWNGSRELVFEPTSEFLTGQTYTVSLAEGIKAANNDTELKEGFEFSFRVRLPEVLYLAPANAIDRNLYAYDLNTGETRQLTNIPEGVYDYAVSPNGQLIAYSRYNEDGSADLWLLDVRSGQERPLTNCASAICVAPSWRPTGTEIAYEREEYDAVLGQVSARRVWVVNIETLESTLLFGDPQIVGYSPIYSGDGSKVAIYASSLPGIMIHDYNQQNQIAIESMQGVVGAFSPDGTLLVYPVLVRGAVGQTFYTHLEMVMLADNTRYRISGPEESALEDRMAAWNPDGKTLAVARKYFDSRGTPGTQIYLLDLETGEATPLVVDANYNHAALQWSPDGRWLVMQRFNMAVQGSRPEIWVYSMDTGELTFITEEAFLPGFLP